MDSVQRSNLRKLSRTVRLAACAALVLITVMCTVSASIQKLFMCKLDPAQEPAATLKMKLQVSIVQGCMLAVLCMYIVQYSIAQPSCHCEVDPARSCSQTEFESGKLPDVLMVELNAHADLHIVDSVELRHNDGKVAHTATELLLWSAATTADYQPHAVLYHGGVVLQHSNTFLHRLCGGVTFR